MMDVLTFIFQDFVHFVGTLILLAVFFDGLEDVVRAIRNRRG